MPLTKSKNFAVTAVAQDQQQEKSKRNVLKVVLCILVMELCERLTYYSIVANLVLYCTSRLEYNSETAYYIVQIFSGKINLKLILLNLFLFVIF